MSNQLLLNISQYFRPRLIDAMRGYNKARFSTDVTAGITVGVIALPLAIAFAIASGAKPLISKGVSIAAKFISPCSSLVDATICCGNDRGDHHSALVLLTRTSGEELS